MPRMEPGSDMHATGPVGGTAWRAKQSCGGVPYRIRRGDYKSAVPRRTGVTMGHTSCHAGKVAIVAGSGGGMGLSVANSLIADNANVSLVDIKQEPADVASGPGVKKYFQGDVSDESFVDYVVANTAEKFGRLDYLVNATGVLWFDRDKSLVDVDLDDWDQVIDINLKSFVLTARHAIPVMRKSGGGAMVHFSSIDALRGDTKPQDAYGVSKAAIIRLSKSIAIQFAKDNIRSNSILPGPILTPMQRRWEDDDGARAEAAQSTPLGRLGRPQDVAEACLFLLSDRASFITGTELIVDGGISAAP